VIVFFPNVLRLLRGIYGDPEVPRTVRVRVWIAIAYNIQPFNLIPDFVPVIGFADNIVIHRLGVTQRGPQSRSRGGIPPLARNPDQYALLVRVARLRPPPEDSIT
jgi:Protein of unknown function (DUF1232)